MGILFNKKPLTINVELAEKIGLNESIIVQQIQYWTEHNKEIRHNLREGYYWAYNTYEEWQKQFPFWSVSTIKRTFIKLEKEGWVISGNYNKLKIDRTKWYRLNYEKLETLDNSPKCQIDTMDGSHCADGTCQYDPTITRDYTENTTETSKKNKGIFPSSQNTALSFSEFEKQYTVDEEAYGAISHYLLCYEQQFGECHPRLKAEQWQRAVDQILYCDEIGGDLEVEQIKAMIDQHFRTRYRDCDYNILHFLSDGVKKCRYYERVYNQDID